MGFDMGGDLKTGVVHNHINALLNYLSCIFLDAESTYVTYRGYNNRYMLHSLCNTNLCNIPPSLKWSSDALGRICGFHGRRKTSNLINITYTAIIDYTILYNLYKITYTI